MSSYPAIRPIRFWLRVAALCLLAPWAPVATAQDDGGVFRVLLIGDSWAEYMWFDGSLRAQFALEGRADVWEKGDVTAISGSTAAEWTQPARLQLIANELAANPSIDLAQVTLGGNDFLAGISGNGWHTGLTPQQEAALVDRVAADIAAVLDFILGLDPEIRIALSLYDYPNFVETLNSPVGFFCRDLWDDLGQPTPEEINAAQIRFIDGAEALALERPRVFLVRHAGSMQAHFGYPSMGILPGQLTPPGDIALPSPPEAMRFLGTDCFHLNAEGYGVLAQNLWREFYVDFLCIDGSQLNASLPTWPTAADIRDLVETVARLCP